jgi:endonuclease/exonuclease/phosphatase family metal-dependent hydrolase
LVRTSSTRPKSRCFPYSGEYIVDYISEQARRQCSYCSHNIFDKLIYNLKMKILFANITHGFVYADDGSTSESMRFTKFSIPDYISYFKKHNPDILCLAETLLDDDQGNSSMVKDFSEALYLPFYKALGHEPSWIYVGKLYGMAILSRYPIETYEIFKLPNPKLEVDRPDGSHWIMHDKFAQYAELEVDGKKLNLFNLHYFPVHHFGKRMQDKDLSHIREELVSIFKGKNLKIPTIITGDFNNKGLPLEEAYPELFEENLFQETVKVETTLCNGAYQLDHVLYTPGTIKLENAFAEKFISDHYALITEVNFI